jgi:hypothetical protein
MKPLNEIICDLLLGDILRLEKEELVLPLSESHDDPSHKESSENGDQ